MEKSVRKVTPLVLALSMALVCGAFAGDNENATFAVTSSMLLTGVGAGELVEISIDTEGWVEVEQVDVTLVVSSAEHFDTAAHVFQGDGGGGSDDQGPGQGSQLSQRDLYVAGSRGQIEEQEVEIAPIDVEEELVDHFCQHRAAPDHWCARVEEQTH